MSEARAEAIARIPADQKFTWRITPQPGRLLFVETVGKSLVALKDVFQSVSDVIGQPHAASILDMRIEDDGAFACDIVLLPIEPPPPQEKAP